MRRTTKSAGAGLVVVRVQGRKTRKVKLRHSQVNTEGRPRPGRSRTQSKGLNKDARKGSGQARQKNCRLGVIGPVGTDVNVKRKMRMRKPKDKVTVHGLSLLSKSVG